MSGFTTLRTSYLYFSWAIIINLSMNSFKFSNRFCIIAMSSVRIEIIPVCIIVFVFIISRRKFLIQRMSHCMLFNVEKALYFVSIDL